LPTSVIFTLEANETLCVATFTSSTGNNLAAGVETLASIVAGSTVLAGDVLELVLTHAGAGTAYGAVLAKVELQ